MPQFQTHEPSRDQWSVCRSASRTNEHRQIPLQHAQILPHIREEYDFKKTNRLLAEKINCPRRNKLFFTSFSFIEKSKKVLFDSHHRKKNKQIPSKQQGEQWIEKRQKKTKSGIEELTENTVENQIEDRFSKFEEITEEKQPNYYQNRRTFIGKIKKNINLEIPPPKLEEIINSQDNSQEQSQEYSQEYSNKPNYRITKNFCNRDLKKNQTITQPASLIGSSRRQHKQNSSGVIGRGDTEIIFSQLNICSKPEIAPETLFIIEVHKIMHSSGKENGNAPRSVLSSAPTRYSTLSSAIKKISFAFRRSPIEVLEVHLIKCKGILCERVSRMEIQLDQFKENLPYQTADKGEPVELQGKRTSNITSGITASLHFKIRLRLH